MCVSLLALKKAACFNPVSLVCKSAIPKNLGRISRIQQSILLRELTCEQTMMPYVSLAFRSIEQMKHSSSRF